MLESPKPATLRPVLRANFESNIPGLYIIGTWRERRRLKLAMEQGSEVKEHIAATSGIPLRNENNLDLVVTVTLTPVAVVRSRFLITTRLC